MASGVFDDQGYRFNVGMVVMNQQEKVLWARRRNNQLAWQFPQGGLCQGETEEQAMYRELDEELGLSCADVEIVARTQEWISYDLPMHLRRYHLKPLCVHSHKQYL